MKNNKLKWYFVELLDNDISIYGCSCMATDKYMALNLLIERSINDKDLIRLINKSTRLEITRLK